jgi:hypothetical protein
MQYRSRIQKFLWASNLYDWTLRFVFTAWGGVMIRMRSDFPEEASLS